MDATAGVLVRSMVVAVEAGAREVMTPRRDLPRLRMASSSSLTAIPRTFGEKPSGDWNKRIWSISPDSVGMDYKSNNQVYWYMVYITRICRYGLQEYNQVYWYMVYITGICRYGLQE